MSVHQPPPASARTMASKSSSPDALAPGAAKFARKLDEPLPESLYHRSPAASRSTNCTPASSSAPSPGRSTTSVCTVAHSPSASRHASPGTSGVSTEISETPFVPSGHSASGGRIHWSGSSRDTPQWSTSESAASAVNTTRRVVAAPGADASYICTRSSPSPCNGYTRRRTSSHVPPAGTTGAAGSNSSSAQRDMNEAATFSGAAVSTSGAHSGPAISARASRSCVSRYCPTSSWGGSTHSSGSVGRVFNSRAPSPPRGGASTTLLARLRLALASASETSHPSYAGVSSPATGS